MPAPLAAKVQPVVDQLWTGFDPAAALAQVEPRTYVVPARYFLVALRGIVLKGSAASHLTVPLLALAAYALAMLGLASWRLSRERA